MRQAAEELKKTKEEMEKLTDIKKQLEERNAMMERELQDLKSNAGATEESLAEAEDRIQELMKVKFEFEDRLKARIPKNPRYLRKLLALWHHPLILCPVLRRLRALSSIRFQKWTIKNNVKMLQKQITK